MTWLYLAAVIVLLFVYGFFSLAETALASFSKYKFQAAASEGSRSARAVLWVDRHFDGALIAILIAIDALSIAVSSFFTFLFLSAFPALDEGAATLISSLAITFVLYVFFETIPKQIAKKIPNKAVSLIAFPLAAFIILLWPLTSLFRALSFVFRKLIPDRKEAALTEEDFTSVIEANEKGGLLNPDESGIIHASFDFADTRVKDVLTPVSEMYAIDLKDLTNRKLADLLCETAYSRIPVFYGSLNRIVGILIVKDYLAMYLRNPQSDVRQSLEKPYIVSPQTSIDDLTDGFRTRQTHMALVYQGEVLVGMVTMEDVLEELVGPIGEKSLPMPEKTIRR